MIRNERAPKLFGQRTVQFPRAIPVKIGILGTGAVGQALAKGLIRAKHEVRLGSRNPAKATAPPGATTGSVKEVAAWADVVILAVPFRAVKETAIQAGAALIGGKILVDATNPISSSGDLAVGYTTSGAEEIVSFFPGALVVKAFNTVFARSMSTGKIGTEPVTLFVAGDQPRAKEVVLRLGRDIGFDAVDAGPLRAARLLEPMLMLMIRMGSDPKIGWDIALRLVRRAT